MNLHLYDLPDEILALIQSHVETKYLLLANTTIRFPKLTQYQIKQRIINDFNKTPFNSSIKQLNNIKCNNPMLWNRLIELKNVISTDNMIWQCRKRTIITNTNDIIHPKLIKYDDFIQPLTSDFIIYLYLSPEITLSNYINFYTILPANVQPFPLTQWVSVCLKSQKKIIVYGACSFIAKRYEINETELKELNSTGTCTTETGDIYIRIPIKYFLLLMNHVFA